MTDIAVDPWKRAFNKAIQIEEDGSKFFSDLNDKEKSWKKRKREADADGNDEISNEIEKVETDPNSSSVVDLDEGCGGFCQPVRLANFVKVMKRGNSKMSADEDGTETAPLSTEVEEAIDIEPPQRDMVEVCGRQICRSWLKNHFLGIGKACDESTCLRKHAITCKPELLYKDYSFKGLSPKQRKQILAQLKAESG
jgi:hypothetical protein